MRFGNHDNGMACSGTLEYTYLGIQLNIRRNRSGTGACSAPPRPNISSAAREQRRELD